MVILIGGEKGGTGKTTLATNLATMFVTQGRDILLVDTDKQGSASYWSAMRDESKEVSRIACVQKFGKSIPAEIADLKKRYGNIIVDAGGRDSVELRAAMVVADRFYVPVQASQFDVWTISTMDELIAQAKALNPGLDAWVIVNRTSTHPNVSEAQEARELMEDFENLNLCEFYVYDRIAYRHAAKSGLGVVELEKGDKKAVEEMFSFYEHVIYETAGEKVHG